MFLVSSCSCLCPIHWSQVLSREWRCSWSSPDRRCSNYIWLINNLIAYWSEYHIRFFWRYLYFSNLTSSRRWLSSPNSVKWTPVSSFSVLRVSKTKELALMRFHHHGSFLNLICSVSVWVLRGSGGIIRPLHYSGTWVTHDKHANQGGQNWNQIFYRNCDLFSLYN